MREVWKTIPGYTRYEASNLGHIRSKTEQVKVAASNYRPAYYKTCKGKIIKPWNSTLGNYDTVGLSVKGKTKKRSVHILVCLAFHGLPPSKELSNALHENGKSKDNRASNLYWGSLLENTQDRRDHGRDRFGEKHPLVKITLKTAQSIYDQRSKGISAKILKVRYGISASSICDIYMGRTWPQVNRCKSLPRFYFHPKRSRQRRRNRARLTRNTVHAIKVR